MLAHAVMGREALPQSYVLHIPGHSEVLHAAPSLPIPPSTLVPSSAGLAANHLGFAPCMSSLCFLLCT